MKVEITYSGKYKGFFSTFIIESKTLKEIGAKVDKEIEKRGWETENCWSEIIEE